MSLVGNERTKLLAGALDRLSTVCVTVGVAAPVSGLFYGVRDLSVSLLAGCYVWVAAAVALHLAARWLLGRLEE